MRPINWIVAVAAVTALVSHVVSASALGIPRSEVSPSTETAVLSHQSGMLLSDGGWLAVHGHAGKPTSRANAGLPRVRALVGVGTACGNHYSTENKFDVVHQFNRPKSHKRMEGGKSKLYCGKHISTQSESAFGLRHIRAGHRSQFQAEADWGGDDWAQWMLTQVTWTLSQPDRRTVQNADRYCYEKEFHYYEDGEVVHKTWVRVILGKTGVRIMTAFPATSSKCTGTKF